MQKQSFLFACMLFVSLLFVSSCSISLQKSATDDEDKTTQVAEEDAPGGSQDVVDEDAEEENQNTDENADENANSGSDATESAPIAEEAPMTNEVVVPAEDWQTYVNENYGFSFRYPSTWTLRKGKNNVIKLVQNTLTLVIRYRSINEETVINSGGVAAGDFETRGMVTFLGEEITRVVLVYQGLDKAVLYNATAEIQAGDLVFTIRLEDLDDNYDAIVIPKVFQAEVDGIVSSFQFTTSTPAASEQGDDDTAEIAEHMPETAEGWVGLIKSDPDSSQLAVYFETTDGTRYDIVAQDPLNGERLFMLRDSGTLAYVWGSIHDSVSDANSAQIRVIRIETDQTQAETAQAQAQLSGDEPMPEETTISLFVDPNMQPQPPSDNDQLGASQPPGTNDGWGEQSAAPENTAPENLDPALADNWIGQFESYPQGSQISYRFHTDDGQSFTLNSMESNIMEQIEQLRWQDARVQLWGQVLTNVPMEPQIQVDRVKVLEETSTESRNLVLFANPSASSELPLDEWGSYYVQHSIDTVIETSWVEGSAGSGVGEWIMLTFPGRFTVERISMSVGFDRDDDIFFANNRVKRATVSFSNGDDVTLDFADTRGLQSKPIPRVRGTVVETSFVKITIDEVYPGSRYNDTCIAEIQVWGKVSVN